MILNKLPFYWYCWDGKRYGFGPEKYNVQFKSPAVLGLYMGSITGGFMAGSFLAGRLAGRLPVTTILIAGRVVACAGLLFGLILHAAGIGHVLALFGPCLFVGVSNGPSLSPSPSGRSRSARSPYRASGLPSPGHWRSSLGAMPPMKRACGIS